MMLLPFGSSLPFLFAIYCCFIPLSCLCVCIDSPDLQVLPWGTWLRQNSYCFFYFHPQLLPHRRTTHMYRDAPPGFIQAAFPLVVLFCFLETSFLSLCSPSCIKFTILCLLPVFNMTFRASTPSKKWMVKQESGSHACPRVDPWLILHCRKIILEGCTHFLDWPISWRGKPLKHLRRTKWKIMDSWGGQGLLHVACESDCCLEQDLSIAASLTFPTGWVFIVGLSGTTGSYQHPSPVSTKHQERSSPTAT